MGKDVEVMENVVEPEVTPVEVVTPTPTDGFNMSAIGRTVSGRIGDAALNMLAGAAVMGAGKACAWVGKQIAGFAKNQFEKAKEKKALKEVEAEAQRQIEAEAEMDNSEE